MARILIVDDEEAFRVALQKTLESMGHTVLSAIHGADALAVLKSGGASDLIISDIRMPELDGLGLLSNVRMSEAPFSKTPIILITGFAEILETQQAYDLGAQEFLAKPVAGDDLANAIERALSSVAPAGGAASHGTTRALPGYCRLSIGDFASGRQIRYGIYLRLAEDNYAKIAHAGEDLSRERIKTFRTKGVRCLYLTRKDFLAYVGFKPGPGAVDFAARDEILGRSAELLRTRIPTDGAEARLLYDSSAFLETTLDLLTEDPQITALLHGLLRHSEAIFTHSLCTALYAVMLAQRVEWHLPNNKFKIVTGCLLQDVGHRQTDPEILLTPREAWTEEQARAFERHPTHGASAINSIASIPADIQQIVKQHHEDTRSQGYPAKLSKSMTHPMARLVAVANQFCNRIMGHLGGPMLKPIEAVEQLNRNFEGRLDPAFLGGLRKVFGLTEPQE